VKRPLSATMLVILVILVSAAWSLAQDPGPDAAEAVQEPLDLDLIERTERRLTQLDVTIRPKKKIDAELPELSVEDLEVLIVGKRVELKYVDRVCQVVPGRPEVAADEPETRATVEPSTPPPPVARNTYIFYFDHTHLTMGGQATALTMAKTMIPELVSNGNRGLVVSSGTKLSQSELTTVADELIEYIDSISDDPRQWLSVAYAEGEAERYNNIVRQREFSYDAAKSLVITYLREERMYMRRELSRFSATLATLGNLDPPKAVLYFADIMRWNPGMHYARFIGIDRGPGKRSEVPNMADESSSFDRVTEAAGAHGVRLYTIQAEGLQTGMLGVDVELSQTGVGLVEASRSPWERTNDAVRTMQSFALETGGEMFFGGVERSTMNKVLNRIESDLSCFYLLSFHSDRLKEDAPLAIRVRFDQDSPRFAELAGSFKIQSRGQLVVLSEARKKESLLLAAHAVSEGVESQPGRGVVIPLGFEDGRFHGMAQFMVFSPNLPEALVRETSWELGMTHVHRSKVVHQTDRRVTIPDPRIPVVLQARWEFAPGENEIVLVGYEDGLGQLITASIDTVWPDPDGSAAAVTQVAIVQPEVAVFVNGAGDADSAAESRIGSLAIGDSAARVDRPIYFVSLVCRKKRDKQNLWIDRTLVGNVSVDFTRQQWDHADRERCVLIQDLVREDRVGWGDFEYHVRVYDDSALDAEPIATRVRKFSAVSFSSLNN